MGIFKACDVRGVYGLDLTDEVVYRIGRAMGTLSRGKVVITGGDVRVSTPSLRSALMNGLTESGADVLDVGIVPTPVFHFARRHLKADAGAMITASHNPPEFNGLKIMLGALPVTQEELGEIERLTESGDFAAGKGRILKTDIVPSYVSFIKSVAPEKEGAGSFKIVIDCGNGCFSELAPGVCRSFGYHIEELFCTPDGTFPNRSPNSATPETLVELCRRVRDTDALLGVAFDGDGDRVSFIDDRGRFLSSDKAISIIAAHALTEHPGAKIVYDLKCSSIVPEEIERSGGIPIPERSGYAFIKTRMILEEAVFGGELSGHYFYSSLNGGDDGLYSALLMAYLLTSTGSRLSELADAVPEYVTTPEIRVPFTGDGQEIVDRIAMSFAPEDVSRLDGVKVDFAHGWGLARVSVTEPVITLRFEAGSEEQLREVVDQFLAPVPEIRERVDAATQDLVRNR